MGSAYVDFPKSEVCKFATENSRSFRKNFCHFWIVIFLGSTIGFDLSLEGTNFGLTFYELLSILIMDTHYRIIL